MPPAKRDAADHLTLAFSSGSAGGLKGLVISREGVEATLPPIFDAIGMATADRLLLFMPMSNFQQRNMCYAALWYAISTSSSPTIRSCSPRIKTLHPTILIAPPMYFQMIYTRFVNFPALETLAVDGSGQPCFAVFPARALRRALARNPVRGNSTGSSAAGCAC